MEALLSQLENEIKSLFHKDSSGHDLHHLKRTLNLALALQEKESGDRTVIAVSALLHDIHRIMQKESGKYCSPKDSLPKISEILAKVDSSEVSEEQKERILNCIEFHEEYDFSKEGKSANDIETLILQDADNLDAMGAIGIARAFSFGGAHGQDLWVPEEPLGRETYDESDELEASVIRHFYDKLLKLKDNMNTKTAKEMAHRRHEYMEGFLKEFFEEWEERK